MGFEVMAGGAAAAAFLKDRTGVALSPDARSIQAVAQNGAIVGVVAFDHWTPNSVYAHVALDAPSAARALLRPAMRYPFVDAGRRVLIGVVSSANRRALALDKHVGFREVARVKDGISDGVDMIVMELRKEECRYL